jgi:hypothetical protein
MAKSKSQEIIHTQQKEILENAFDRKNIIDINKIVNEFLITNS